MAKINVYRNDRRNHRGVSTANFVKNTIVHIVCDLDELVNLEATADEGVTATAGTIRLLLVYCPQNRPLLDSDLDLFLQSRSPTAGLREADPL